MILAQMLKEDDNRFCADCDTKSKARRVGRDDKLRANLAQVLDGQAGILASSSAFVVRAFTAISACTSQK